MSVCLSVCLFVVGLHYLRTTRPNVLYMFSPGRSSFEYVARGDMLCVLSILRMTSCFNITERVDPNQRWRVAYVSSCSLDGGTSRTSDNVLWSRSLSGGTGGEVCRLRLHLVFRLHWPGCFQFSIELTVAPSPAYAYWRTFWVVEVKTNHASRKPTNNIAIYRNFRSLHRSITVVDCSS